MTELFAFERIVPEVLQSNLARAKGLAELVWMAGQDFYGGFPQDRDIVLRAIGRQIGSPEFDLADTLVLHDSEDAALVAGTAVASLSAAQTTAALIHLKSAGRAHRTELAAHLRAYSAQLEPVDGTGHYISRVAVAPHRRGNGLGRHTMTEYLARLGRITAHLHVHRSNAPAVSLYKALGFLPHGDSGLPYLLLTRPA